jgi:DNA invertase Pin-like site-specific DNA recombinase
VSISDQKVDLQLDALREYAARRGAEIIEEYIDAAVSGARAKRPALDRLMADARRRRFDGVVIWKLDRLARSVHHLTAVAKEFEALGIDLVVTTQAIDTSTPNGRFLFHTLAAVAELERDLIRERVCAGMQAAKRRGKHVGRRHALRGSDTFRVEQMLREGTSVRAIGRELGVAPSTVRGTIQRLGLGPA